MTPSPLSGALPDDLAHPREDRAYLLANLAVAGVLLAITAALAIFAVVAPW